MLLKSLRHASLLCALSITAHATDSQGLPQGKLNNLSAKYQSPSGTGKAAYINFQDFGEYRNADLEVENYNGLLIFNLRDENEDKSFELDLSTFGITDADSINLNQLNFSNDAKRINLNINSANAKAEDKSTSFSGASINCHRDKVFEDITDDLLSACLKNSSLSISNLNIRSGKSEFVSIVTNEYDEVEILGSAIKLDYLKLNINGHNFKGETKGDVTKNVKVKFEGQTHYFQDKRQVRVKISKAKAGFISVKGTIFKELKKAQSDNLRVNEPYIYINLPNE